MAVADVLLPTGSLPARPSTHAAPLRLPVGESESVDLLLAKRGKGRCGLSLQRMADSLVVTDVADGSLAAEAGFRVGDALQVVNGLDVKLDLRLSKIKANGQLFDAKGTCVVTVSRQKPIGGEKAMPVVLSSAAASAGFSGKAYASIDSATGSTGASQASAVADAIAAAEAKVAAAMARAAEEARRTAAATAAERAAKLEAEVEASKAEAEARARAAAEEAARRRQQQQQAVEAAEAKAEEAKAAAAAAAAAAGGSSSNSAIEAPNGSTSSVAASEAAASSSTEASTSVDFRRGDGVLYENTRTGALEMAKVVGVHRDAPEARRYTVELGGGGERTAGASQLRMMLMAKSCAGDLGADDSARRPPPRLGSGNPLAQLVKAAPSLPIWSYPSSRRCAKASLSHPPSL